jgi:hypothetical protein
LLEYPLTVAGRFVFLGDIRHGVQDIFSHEGSRCIIGINASLLSASTDTLIRAPKAGLQFGGKFARYLTGHAHRDDFLQPSIDVVEAPSDNDARFRSELPRAGAECVMTMRRVARRSAAGACMWRPPG